VDVYVSLIEVFWAPTTRQYKVYARTSGDDDWSRFDGDENEVDTLLSLARDVMTGG
jgi:hypothetical protein